MGFFKKIGSAIKKGVKQISLKNVVKIGTPLLSMIPVVGGLAKDVVSGVSASHEAKKLAKQAEEAGNAELAAAYQAQADQLAATSGQIVGQQAGSVLSAFSKGAKDEMVATASAGLKTTAGEVGAEIADQSIKAWFIKHWWHLGLALLAVVGGIFAFRRNSNNNRPSKKYGR
jgi:hypothetical protein